MRRASWREQIDLLRKGRVSPAFVTNTASKKRLFVDYGNINTTLAERTLQMDQLGDLVAVLRPRDSLFKADITDAYYHLRLRKTDQMKLSFYVDGVVYVSLSLSCGLSVAPWSFTKLMKPVVSHLRSKGHRICSYLDDFLARRAPIQLLGTPR